MELNQNPFPKIELFPRLEAAARFVKRLVGRLPDSPNSGGAPLIDASLYDDIQVKGFLYDGTDE